MGSSSDLSGPECDFGKVRLRALLFEVELATNPHAVGRYTKSRRERMQPRGGTQLIISKLEPNPSFDLGFPTLQVGMFLFVFNEQQRP